MPQRLSEVFGVPITAFSATGAFDAFVGVDARLHLDPHLLAASQVPEFSQSRAVFDNHFVNVIKLLRQANGATGPLFAEAVRRLTFREIPNTGLGYSRHGKAGSGIGERLAKGIGELGKVIVDAGIEDPDIFALMGLLQDGIGADRISDMTAAIVIEPLLAFSDRAVRALALPARPVVRGSRSFSIPVVPRTNEAIVLVPRDLLRHLPVAESWSDIDTVSSHNAQLRQRVNSMIGDTWRKASLVPKSRLRQALLKHPELIRDLLAQYKDKPADSYDLERDPNMLYLWQPVTREVAAAAPLALVASPESPFADLVQVVRQLMFRFKELVEANRLYRLLYNDDDSHRREKAAQLALFGIADAYCAANNVDLSPETDSGTGPVDFKFSRGYRGRILAEVKLSSSSKLKEGFDEQLAAYGAAERAHHSFYVVVRIDETERPLNELRKRINVLKRDGVACPELVIVDARPTRSASKR